MYVDDVTRINTFSFTYTVIKLVIYQIISYLNHSINCEKKYIVKSLPYEMKFHGCFNS